MHPIFSHPLCTIAWVDSGILNSDRYILSDSMSYVFINLNNNKWSNKNHIQEIFKTEGNYLNGTSFHEGKYLLINYSKRYFLNAPLISGNLVDQQILKLVQIISGLTKYAYQPKITISQVKLFLLQMEVYPGSPASTISFSNALEVFNWVELLKIKSVVPLPILSLKLINRISKSFYGSSHARLKRKISLAKAMYELLTTDNTLLNIGSGAGYRNRDYFNSTFKKEFSVSPGVLRLFYRDQSNHICEKL
jgi:AraC-like DNA-binding protein